MKKEVVGYLIGNFTYGILVNPHRNPSIEMLLFNNISPFLMDKKFNCQRD